MISIRFRTDVYANTLVSLRNSIDGWDSDVIGTYADRAWRFDLDAAQYAEGFTFKFFLREAGAYNGGPNLVFDARSNDVVEYDQSTIVFPFFIELRPGDYLGVSRTYFIRTSAEGWDRDIPRTNSDLNMYQWQMEWGRYRDGVDFKFLLVPDPSRGPAKSPLWMLGHNLQFVPEVGRYRSYAAGARAGAGAITFPFTIRFITPLETASVVTLRDDRHGWTDWTGVYQDGAWCFELPWSDYFDSASQGPRPVIFKFVKDGIWMRGQNLQIGPNRVSEPGEYPSPGRSYDFDASRVQFPAA